MARATLAEWLLPLSLATDVGAALPKETAVRTALVAVHLADQWSVKVDRHDVFFGALLRHLGCTSTATTETRIMGDEHELRSSLALADAASPVSMFSGARRGFGVGKPKLERARRVARFLAFAPREVPRIFTERCEVAVHLSARLGLPKSIQRIFDEAYERHDGKGAPAGKKGEAICPAARLLSAAEVVAMCSQLPGGTNIAKDLLAHRSGTQFDPAVVKLFTTHWSDLLQQIEGDVRTRLFEREPGVSLAVDLGDADLFAAAFADFVDLKSPFTVGHSRMVSALAEDAARELGLPEVDRRRLATAGLLHDLGRVSVSNAVWDKVEPLTDGEREAIRGHASFTEQILQASKPWKDIAILAASDHERSDGSGYPRMALAPNAGLPARILAAADVLAALVTPRPHRAAYSLDVAARMLGDEAGRGRLDRACVDAVLTSQGMRAKERPRLAAGITERELEVLRLVARGLVDKEIGAELGISHRTVHHHNQSLFQKIGVTTRSAAALFAVENGLL